MTMTYYKTGEQESVTDWRGFRTDYTIDKLGRTTVVDEAVGQTEARTMTTVYNTVGEATSSIDYNDVTSSVVYDALGRATSTTSAVGEGVEQSSSTQYDANGNMTGDEHGKTSTYDTWKRKRAARPRLTFLLAWPWCALTFNRHTASVGQCAVTTARCQ